MHQRMVLSFLKILLFFPSIGLWDVVVLRASTPPLLVAPFSPEQANEHQAAWAKELE